VLCVCVVFLDIYLRPVYSSFVRVGDMLRNTFSQLLRDVAEKPSVGIWQKRDSSISCGRNVGELAEYAEFGESLAGSSRAIANDIL